MLKYNWKISLILALGLIEIGFIYDGTSRKVNNDHETAMQDELAKVNEFPSVKPAYDFWKSKDSRLTPHSNSLSALNNVAAAQKRGAAKPYNETVKANEHEIDKAHDDFISVRAKAENEIRQRYAQMATFAGNDKQKVTLRVLSAAVLPVLTLICAAYIIRKDNQAYTVAAFIASAAAQYGSARMMFQNVQSWSAMPDYSLAYAIAFACGMLAASRWAVIDLPTQRPGPSMTVISTREVTVTDLPRELTSCVKQLAELKLAGEHTPSVRKVAEYLNLRSHSHLHELVKEEINKRKVA